MAAPVILVEAAPRRAADGVPVTVRLAGGGATVAYHYGGEHWRAGLTGLPKSTASLDFDGEQLGGGGVAQSIELGWAPASSAALSELSDLYWTDAPITVRVGPEGAAMPAIVSQGLVLEAPVDRGTLRIALADQTADLNRALLTDRYLGTGGIEGPTEFESLIKSRAWGRCFNVPGRQIDAATNIWVFGDPRRAWSSFDQVRDKGVAADAGTLTVLGWQGSAEATFAALKVTPATEGGGVLCPSIACVKWWTQPAGDLHADIRGETDGGYVETAPEIAQRIVAARSTLTFAAGAVAAAAAARPAPFGWRVDSDSSMAASEISTMLGGVSLSWLLVDGAIVFRPWDWTAPIRVGRSFSVTRRSTTKPIGSRKLGYRRNWSPMARGDLAAIVLSLDVVYEDGTPIENLKPATPGATAGAPVGTTIGGVVQPDGTIAGGMPAGLALTTLEKIVPIEAATDLLKQANINQDAILRQADDAKQVLAQEQLRAVLAANTQRVTLRDAGLFVDPETGRVGITAVDQTQDRVSKVEINLDAVTGQIALRATYNDVATAIAQAQLNPGQAADLSNIIARLNSAELSLSGLNAAIVLKADAVTVTQLGGLVQSVSQTLDALAGVVATKASTTSVTALGERVGSAEAILSSLGDVSSFSISLRQADVRNTSASLGALSNLLADDDANRRQIVAAAEVNQQLYARLVDGDAAEAASRLLLTARVGAAEGRLATEELVRADQYGALTRSTTALQASYNDLAGSVQTLRQATADADQANATAITQVSARIGDFGLVSVQQAFNVLATRTGQLEGQYTLSISTNGRLQGYKLAGSASGPATFSFIDTDLNMGTGRIIFNNGSFMQVQGIGFGADGKLIEWYGPSLANLAQCTIDNAIAYKTNDGRAVFRGATGSGAAPLSVSTFALGANQLTSPAWAKTSAVTRVQAAFSWSNYGVRAAPQAGAAPQVTFILYRKLGSAAEVEVGRVTEVGTTAFDETSPAAFTQNVNANLAYADSDASTDTRVWRVAVALISNIPGGTSSRPDELSQSITITATPQ